MNANITDVSRCRSLSARRAWIEMELAKKAPAELAVALRKESVDRNAVRPYDAPMRRCRSPQGERG